MNSYFPCPLHLYSEQTLTDVQTDVQIVPVDSEVQFRNLLILPTSGGALVLYIGNLSLRKHHYLPQMLNNSLADLLNP